MTEMCEGLSIQHFQIVLQIFWETEPEFLEMCLNNFFI